MLARPAGVSGRRRDRRLWWLAAGAALVAVVLALWQAGSFTSGRETLNPLPGPPDPGPDISSGAGASPGARPSEGSSRPPALILDGGPVWFAPAPDVEAALPTTDGPLPEEIRVDQGYPLLEPGDVTRALMVMGVVDGTSTVTRLLVLDESWQVFEVDLGPVRRAGVGGPILSSHALSPDGTRLALGLTGGYVELDLSDLTTQHVAVSDASPGELSWSHGTVVVGNRAEEAEEPSGTRTASIETVAGHVVRAEHEHPSAVRVRGEPPALLVLDGDRGSGCCKVAGWSTPGQVLYESRTGPLMHVLDWDTETGSVALVSTIQPVVSSTSYLQTTYARF